MSEFVPEINILSKEEFIPSTITMKGIFSSKIDINIIASFLFVKHAFDKDNERIRLISGSRQSIEYSGNEGDIVSVGYKSIRRGMRTGAMNNMVSVDMQLGGKNIHIKLSATSITSVGTSTFEAGKKVVDKILEHIKDLQKILDFSNSLEREEKSKNIEWLKEESKGFKKGLRYSEIIERIKIPNHLNHKYISFLLKYFDDYDDLEDFHFHIDKTVDNLDLSEQEISCVKYDIFNSVYHIKPIANPNFRMPLHKLAPFLANPPYNISTSWHNAISEGINICFDIEEEKEGINHEDKFYKHRFTIPITSKIKQTSPSSKDEAYKYYLGTMNILKMFFQQEDIDFKKYVTEDIQGHDNVKILLKMKK